MFAHGPWRLPLINAVGSENTTRVGCTSENCRADRQSTGTGHREQGFGERGILFLLTCQECLPWFFFYFITLFYFMCVLVCVHVSTNIYVLVPMEPKSQPLLAEESGWFMLLFETLCLWHAT